MKTEKKSSGLVYSTIIHGARVALKISILEYVVSDSIYHLSTNPNNKKYPGWCFATKPYLAEALGTSENSIRRAIKKLIDLDIIETHKSDKVLYRTTQKWFDSTILGNYRQGAQNGRVLDKLLDKYPAKMEDKSSKMAPPIFQNGTHYNNNDNNNEKGVVLPPNTGSKTTPPEPVLMDFSQGVKDEDLSALETSLPVTSSEETNPPEEAGDSPEVAEEFDSHKAMCDLILSDELRKHIVGIFFEHKNFVAPSKEIFNYEFRKNIRAATLLAEYGWGSDPYDRLFQFTDRFLKSGSMPFTSGAQNLESVLKQVNAFIAAEGISV